MSILTPYIRSSSYGCWDFCQLQYYQIYVLGNQNKTGLKAELGTATHKVMEILGCCKKAIQNDDKLVVEDDALGEIKFTRASLYTDKFVDKLIDMSYKHYKKHSENDFDKDGFSVKVGDENVKDTFSFVEKMVYLGLKGWKGVYDPRNRDIRAMEPHFDLPIEEDWAKFTFEKDGMIHEGQLSIKGTIDTVTNLDENTIEVIDWKTGERKDFATGEEKDYNKLCKDPQLLLYNHAISRLYPDVPNRIMTINFLRNGGPFSMCFDEDDNKMFLKMLKERFQTITTCRTPKPVSPSRSSWKCQYVCGFSQIDPETGLSPCVMAEKTIRTYGIDVATVKLKKAKFDPNFYNAPG
jgi:PD-(D/E)XK nuclease superfamily